MTPEIPINFGDKDGRDKVANLMLDQTEPLLRQFIVANGLQKSLVDEDSWYDIKTEPKLFEGDLKNYSFERSHPHYRTDFDSEWEEYEVDSFPQRSVRWIAEDGSFHSVQIHSVPYEGQEFILSSTINRGSSYHGLWSIWLSFHQYDVLKLPMSSVDLENVLNSKLTLLNKVTTINNEIRNKIRNSLP